MSQQRSGLPVRKANVVKAASAVKTTAITESTPNKNVYKSPQASHSAEKLSPETAGLAKKQQRLSISSQVSQSSETSTPCLAATTVAPASPAPALPPAASSTVASLPTSVSTESFSGLTGAVDLIKVCVRVRPLVREEREVNETIAWSWDDHNIHALTNPYKRALAAVTSSVVDSYVPSGTNFSYDYLFGPESQNEDIFQAVVKDIVLSTMNGFHGSVFCYGQTSTGKTFTMSGSGTQRGLLPQAVDLCFEAINNFPDREFLFRVSYLEVYNEQVKDLLNPEPVVIKILHDPKQGTILQGAKEQVVLSPQQVISLLKAGEAQRHIGATDMNEKSSRAHTLFKLIVESKERSKSSGPVRVSTLNLVDLAGSESAKLTNTKGERLREAKHINQSLLTLSTIIHKLSEDRHAGGSAGRRAQHLPYRDSKLTRLLETALDGNAHIAIVCTISPAQRCTEETANTLKFAARAKLIRQSAKVNENMDDKTLLRAYREEIEQLRSRLRELEERNNQSSAAENVRSEQGGKDEAAALEIPAASMTANTSAKSYTTLDDSIVEGEEQRAAMLQMIAEMERLILRADKSQNVKPPTSSAAQNKALNRSKSSVRLSSSRSAQDVLAHNKELLIGASPRVTTLIRKASIPGSSASPPPVTPQALRKTDLEPIIDCKSRSNSILEPPSLENNKSDGDVGEEGHISESSPASSSSTTVGNGTWFTVPSMAAQSDGEVDVPTSRPQPLYPLPKSHSAMSLSSREIQLKLVSDDVTLSPSHSPLPEAGEDGKESDSVFLGVSTMLHALRDFIARAQSSTQRPLTRVESTADAAPANFSNAAERGDASHDDMVTVSRSEYEQLQRDLKLKDADNRFLLEELEKKDRMLAMLTEGLKEVEISQLQWLSANKELSNELDRMIVVNELLEARLLRYETPEEGDDGTSNEDPPVEPETEELMTHRREQDAMPPENNESEETGMDRGETAELDSREPQE